MSTDLKRMLQRRGLKKDLPDAGSMHDGEILITSDTNEMFFTNNQQYIKTLTQSDIYDALDSTDNTIPLSANQGRVLDDKISNINTYWQSYTNNMLIEIEKKQDIILHKDTSAPSDKSLIWYKI